jgi:hypothetical protein
MTMGDMFDDEWDKLIRAAERAGLNVEVRIRDKPADWKPFVEPEDTLVVIEEKTHQPTVDMIMKISKGTESPQQPQAQRGERWPVMTDKELVDDLRRIGRVAACPETCNSAIARIEQLVALVDAKDQALRQIMEGASQNMWLDGDWVNTRNFARAALDLGKEPALPGMEP